MKQKKITRQAPVQKVVGKPAAKPGRQMSPAARVSNVQIGADAGIGTAPPKFVPQVRKK
jgi:hypothetical protein